MSMSCSETDDIEKIRFLEEYNYINRSNSEVTITSFSQGESSVYSIDEGDTLTLSGITPNSNEDIIVDDDSATISVGENLATFYAGDTASDCNILYSENYQYEERGEDQVFYYTFTESICE